MAETLDDWMDKLEKAIGEQYRETNAYLVPIPVRESRKDQMARISYVINKELGEVKVVTHSLDAMLRQTTNKLAMEYKDKGYSPEDIDKVRKEMLKNMGIDDNMEIMLYMIYHRKNMPEACIYIMQSTDEDPSVLEPELTIALSPPGEQLDPKITKQKYDALIDTIRDFMQKYYESYSIRPAISIEPAEDG